MFPLLIAVAKGYYDIAELMLKNKSLDVQMKDRNGVNAFWLAAWFGHIDIMRLLGAAQVDVLAANQNGSNALHVSVKNGRIAVVEELLKLRDFPRDAQKHNGVTALGIAAHKGLLEMLDLLLAHGANLNATDS